VANTFAADGELHDAPPALSKEELKSQREAERSAQKVANSAPKKLAKVEERISEAEATLEALEEEMVSAGADVGRLSELEEKRRALQAQMDDWYVEMEEIEARRLHAAQMLETALNRGLRESPAPAPPPPPPLAVPGAPSKLDLAKLKEELAAEAKAGNEKKKRKVGKREREEYATIEADIEALEAALAKAEADLEEANSSKQRPAQMELLALAAAASDARSALDDKMERFLELEDLMLAT